MRLSHRSLQPRLPSDEFMTSGKYPRILSAETLYDLLGVRPNDDAEALQNAFRNAVRAHHPDLNPGDPDAPGRFNQIVIAYGILRDAEYRGAYDRLLAVERARRRTKRIRIILSDAVAIVSLTVAMIGGYTLFAHVSNTSIDGAKMVEIAPRKPALMTAIQPTIRAETASRDQPSKGLAGLPETAAVPRAPTPGTNTGSSSEIADSGPAEIHIAKPAPTDRSSRDEPSSTSNPPAAPSAVPQEEKKQEPLVIADGGPASDPSGSNGEVAKAQVDQEALTSSVNPGGPSEIADGSQAGIHVVEPAPTDKSSRDEPSGISNAPIAPSAVAQEEKRQEPLVIANGGPASDPTGSNIEVAKAQVDRGEGRSGADDHTKNNQFESPHQNRIRSVERQFSSLEKDRSSSANLGILDEKHNIRTNAKLRAHAKRPATDQTSVKQAALEGSHMSQVALVNRNTLPCAGSCSDRAPPLFGVGF
jgi:DnaJ domain